MGTCFSYIKRSVKMKRRYQPHYCLSPRSFYQRDTETVELQYLVSVDNDAGDCDTIDNTLPEEVADINENISCHSKRTCSSRRTRILRRLLSWLESENDTSTSDPAPTEGDLMLRMMLSNSSNRITVIEQQDDNAIGDLQKDNNVEQCNNLTSNTHGCNIQNNASSRSYQVGMQNKSTMKSPLHSNFRNISCCSSKAPSNSNSNASSIDLEWEPEGHPMASGEVNKTNKKALYQQQSSEDSVEVSLLSSAESLEWDSCEGSGIILDSDTEQLLQEIERLTARALKETGCECDLNDGNVATSMLDYSSYTNR